MYSLSKFIITISVRNSPGFCKTREPELGDKIKYAISTLICAMLVSSSALADCSTRHIYNQTGRLYVARLHWGTCSYPGNNEMRVECDVHPGQAIELHYSNFGDTHNPATQIGMHTADGRQFTLTAVSWFSCKLSHPNDTGELVINEPVDGDITIQCRGNCKAGPSLEEQGNPWYR